MRKKHIWILLFVMTVFNSFGQLNHSGRGMYVDKFFRTTVDGTGATIVNTAASILTVTAKENALLQYAKDNHITYLVLYDLHRVLGTSYETALCSFIHKAKNSYCIELIGIASACSSLYDEVGIAVPTPPYPRSQNVQSDPLSFVQFTYSPNNFMFYRSETAKLQLRAVDFNDNCADKIDVFVSEYEFWNGASFNDNCTDEAGLSSAIKWGRFQNLTNDMDNTRDLYNGTHAHTIYCEAYLGYLDNDDANGIQNDVTIANWVDGMTANSTRRFDRINTHYYTSDQTKAYSRTTAGQNFDGYYNKRFLDFCQSTTNAQTNLHPIFSTEYYPWQGTSNYLPYWINQNVQNNIFTAEKIWYDQWYDDATNFHSSTVGNATLGNVIQPGGVQYFTSSYMVGHLDNPVIFLSNSPICVQGTSTTTPTFEYLGPIEQGLSFKFYLSNVGSTTAITGCGTTNDIPWPDYDEATQTGIELNQYLTACNLSTGNYEAHLELTYAAGCTYPSVLPISVTNSASIIALTNNTVCFGEPIYLQASSSSSGTTTYQWKDGTSNVGTNSSYFAPNAPSVGMHNYSCVISNPTGCSASPTNVIPVTIAAIPAATITSQSHTQCAIVLNATPAGMNYLWHDNSTAATFSTSQSGTYSVTITEPIAGCSNTVSFTYQKPKINLDPTISSCYNSSTGIIPTLITTGTPFFSPYTLSWSGSATGNANNVGSAFNIVNLPAGNYTVTITDASGCSKTASTTINANSQITANTASTPSSCQTSADGSATVSNPSGGTGPYSYHWHFNNSTAATISGLLPGVYDVDITDNVPCTTTVSITVGFNTIVTAPSVSIASNASNNTTCANLQVTLTATGNGGTGTNYAWYNSASTTNPVQTGSSSIYTFTPTITGTFQYYVVMTAPSSGCVSTASTPSNTVPLTVTPFIPLDLFVKDNTQPFGLEDNGIEPNPDNGDMWVSPDIWVTQNGHGSSHIPENANYNSNPNNVWVTVRNRGCINYDPGASTTTAELHLYWAKGSSALSWPNYWNNCNQLPPAACGSGPTCQPLCLGQEIGSQTIPYITAKSQIIMPAFIWNCPNSNCFNYLNCLGQDYEHFCLLARIVFTDGTTDQMFTTEVSDEYTNAQNNNNVAWKNITIVSTIPGAPNNSDCLGDKPVGGIISVGNPFKDADTYQLNFKVDDNYTGVPIFEQAEIKVTLDETTWNKWAAGGYNSANFKIKREDCRQLIVTGSPAILKNLSYDSNERSMISLSFNFLTDKVDQTPNFLYHVIQVRNDDNRRIIGGELYQIGKPSRYLFDADGGGDKTISYKDNVQLSAVSIGEPAFYNWYDEDGNIIFTGQNFIVSPEFTKKYKLEVIAKSDGFTSYDSLIVHVKEFEIINLSPNPAIDQLTVEYEAQHATSAYFSIVQPYTSVSNNYLIDPSLHSASLNLTGYAPGNYFIRLICDGQIRDEKNLVIIQ